VTSKHMSGHVISVNVPTQPLIPKGSISSLGKLRAFEIAFIRTFSALYQKIPITTNIFFL
jgi:hypothetical protein